MSRQEADYLSSSGGNGLRDPRHVEAFASAVARGVKRYLGNAGPRPDALQR